MAQYADEFIDRLHLLWGAGFLSPGGAEETAAIVDGLDLAARCVLDIGCGTGGPAIVLAEMGARLVAIDVETQLIDRARRQAAAAGVGDVIDFLLVAPGPLAFEAETFDVVFSKDALLHIPDKAALYADIHRVLKPGGVFAASDWLAGPAGPEDAALRRYCETSGLDVTMATAAEIADAMRKAGFVDVSTRDRGDWYGEVAAEEAAAIEGPLRSEIIAVSSPEIHAQWATSRRALADAAASGGMSPTHLRGRRPS